MSRGLSSCQIQKYISTVSVESSSLKSEGLIAALEILPRFISDLAAQRAVVPVGESDADDEDERVGANNEGRWR